MDVWPGPPCPARMGPIGLEELPTAAMPRAVGQAGETLDLAFEDCPLGSFGGRFRGVHRAGLGHAKVAKCDLSVGCSFGNAKSNYLVRIRC